MDALAYGDPSASPIATPTPILGASPTLTPALADSSPVPTASPAPTLSVSVTPTVNSSSAGTGQGEKASPGPNSFSGAANNAGPGSQATPFKTWQAGSFHMANGLVVDAQGNIDVVDTLNSRIRQIGPNGVVTTLGGTFSRDVVDGPGPSATFDMPCGIAYDTTGNIYIADSGNDLIRKMNGADEVTTLAGQAGVTGVQNGNGTGAFFNNPRAVAVDANGNLYVADTNNNLIRKINPNRDVTTLAGKVVPGFADGNGSDASFNHPLGIAVDASGIVYVADTANHLIRKITPKGVVTTLAGGGTGAASNGLGPAASFNWPSGIAVDGSGNLFVADSGNGMIRKITPAGLVSTYAGPNIKGTNLGPPHEGTKFLPYGVAVDSQGNVYGVAPFEGLIWKITPND